MAGEALRIWGWRNHEESVAGSKKGATRLLFLLRFLVSLAAFSYVLEANKKKITELAQPHSLGLESLHQPQHQPQLLPLGQSLHQQLQLLRRHLRYWSSLRLP